MHSYFKLLIIFRPVPNQRVQSTIQRSSTQTQRQVTTNYFNQQSQRQFMTNQQSRVLHQVIIIIIFVFLLKTGFLYYNIF